MVPKRILILFLFVTICKISIAQDNKYNNLLLKPGYHFPDSVLRYNFSLPPLIKIDKPNVVTSAEPYDSTRLSKDDYQRLVSIFGSYSEFKKQFLDMALHDELPDLGLPKATPGAPGIFHKNMNGTPGFSMTSPISLLYNAFSKEERSKRKVFALEAYAPVRKRIVAKYNRQNLENWTGLKGDKLTKFVLFCNFNDTILADINEYDLIDSINLRLKEFIALNDTCN